MRLSPNPDAPIDEGDPGTGDQIRHGPRHEHLSGSCQGGNASADVYCDASDVVAAQLDLSRVQAGSSLDADAGQLVV